MTDQPMNERQKAAAREFFRAMSAPIQEEAPRRAEDDLIEALELDAEAHEAAARECRRTVRFLRERQRIGDVRKALRGEE